MQKLHFAVIGTGFWSNYQIPGWLELGNLKCLAAYNRTVEKARKIGQKFDIPYIYDNPETLVKNHDDLDFVDICTHVETHLPFTKLAAEHGLDVVCQKPMAGNLKDAREMLDICTHNGVKLFINENFRWQAPIRALKAIIDSGKIGKPFKARISFCTNFPVFENQPFLKEASHFIIADVGSHTLDVCRFLFGEAETLYCQTAQINPTIQGEDVASILLKMVSGLTCFVEMSYASRLEKDSFPEVLVLVEGSLGSVNLDHGYEIKITNKQGTVNTIVEPQHYPWVNPEYAVVHSSIVDCQRNLLDGLRGKEAETTGADNLKTMELVWGSYHSADKNELVRL